MLWYKPIDKFATFCGREERIKNNLSQEDVARAIGSTKQAIYKYEMGIVTNIPIDKIEKMADLFCVTPAYLTGWDNTSAIMHNNRVESCSVRIRTALKLKGIKQAELCKMANVPKSSLSLYLSGAYEPKQDRIYLMAKALNVSDAWLFGYNVPMERQANTLSVQDDELSENKKKLIELARSVPEDKVNVIMRVMKSIIEGD